MRPIVFLPASARQWAGLSKDVRRRIDAKLTEFAASGKGDVKRLRGRAGVRLRIGDWRVIFEESSEEIVIVAVGHRRDVYD